MSAALNSSTSGSLKELAARLQFAYGTDSSRRSELPSAIDDGSSTGSVSAYNERDRYRRVSSLAPQPSATQGSFVPRQLPFQAGAAHRMSERQASEQPQHRRMPGLPVRSAVAPPLASAPATPGQASGQRSRSGHSTQAPASGLRKFQSPPLLPSSRTPDSPDSEDTHVEAQALWTAFTTGLRASPSVHMRVTVQAAGEGSKHASPTAAGQKAASPKLLRKDGTVAGSPVKPAAASVSDSESFADDDEDGTRSAALRRSSARSLATTSSAASAQRALKYTRQPPVDAAASRSPEKWPLRVLTESSASTERRSIHGQHSSASTLQGPRPPVPSFKPPARARRTPLPLARSATADTEDLLPVHRTHQRSTPVMPVRPQYTTKAGRHSVSPTRFVMSGSQYKAWMSDRARRPVTDSAAFLGRLLPAHAESSPSLLLPKHKSWEQFLARAEEAVQRKYPHRGSTTHEHYAERVAVNVPPLLIPSECRILADRASGRRQSTSAGLVRVHLHVSRAHLLAEASTTGISQQGSHLSPSSSLVPDLWRFLNTIRNGGRSLDLDAAQQSCAVRLCEQHVKRRVFARLRARMHSRQAAEVVVLRRSTWMIARTLSAWKAACAVVASRHEAAVALLKKVRLRRQATVFYAWAGHARSATSLRLRTAAYQAHRLCRAVSLWRTHCYEVNRERHVGAWAQSRSKHRVLQGLRKVTQSAKERRLRVESAAATRQYALMRSVFSSWHAVVSQVRARVQEHYCSITVRRRKREAVTALRAYTRQSMTARQTFLQVTRRLSYMRAKRGVQCWRAWLMKRGRSRAVKAHVQAWHKAKVQEKVLYGWKALVLRRAAADLHLQERAEAHYVRYKLRYGLTRLSVYLRLKRAARNKAAALLQQVERNLQRVRILALLRANVMQERAYEQAMAMTAAHFRLQQAVGKVFRRMGAHASRRIAARQMMGRAAEKWRTDAKVGTVHFWLALTRRRRHLRGARAGVVALCKGRRKEATLRVWVAQVQRRQRLRYAYSQLARVVLMLKTAKQFYKWRVHTRKIRLGARKLVEALAVQHKRVKMQAMRTWEVKAHIASLRLQALKSFLDASRQKQLTAALLQWRVIACTKARLSRGHTRVSTRRRARTLQAFWTKWTSAYDMESRVRRLEDVSEQYYVQHALRSAVNRLREWAARTRQQRQWLATASALYRRNLKYRVLSALCQAARNADQRERSFNALERTLVAKQRIKVKLTALRAWKLCALQKRLAKRHAAATVCTLLRRQAQRTNLLHWYGLLPQLRLEAAARRMQAELEEQARLVAKAEAAQRAHEEQLAMMEQERLAAERQEARAVACVGALRRAFRSLAIAEWRTHVRTRVLLRERLVTAHALLRQRALRTSLRLWHATLVERIEQLSAMALLRQAELRHVFDRLHAYARQRKVKARKMLVLRLALQEGSRRTYAWSCAMLDCLPQRVYTGHAVVGWPYEEEDGEIVGFRQADTVLHSTALIARIWAKLKAGAQASKAARSLWRAFIDSVRNDVTLYSQYRVREAVRMWRAQALLRTQLARADALAERLAAKRAEKGAGQALQVWRSCVVNHAREHELVTKADGYLFTSRAYKGLAALQAEVNASHARRAAAAVISSRHELRLKIRSFIGWKQCTLEQVVYKASLLQRMKALQQETPRTLDESITSSSTAGFASPGRRLLRDALSTHPRASHGTARTSTTGMMASPAPRFQFTDLR